MNKIAVPGRVGRIFPRVLLIVVISIFMPPTIWSDSQGYALAGPPVVRVGIYENPPKVFLDLNGRPSGIFVDILESIAAEEGWRLEYRSGTWPECLDRLERGEIDIMPDVAKSLSRDALFDFCGEPVLSDWFQVYARKGSGIRSILDLDGKRILVLERSVQQESFEQIVDDFMLTITMIPVSDYRLMFLWVGRGEADAAITNRFFGLANAEKFGLEDTAVIFNPTSLFFAAPKGKGKWILDAVDSDIARMKKDPQSEYYRSLTEWTSEKVRFVFPAWLIAVIVGAGWILMMSIAGSILLKRQVNTRTRELREINREMEARIVERTAELAEAVEKAKTADRLKSAFLATMSHELRTPLNSIIGFTGILLQELAGPMNDEQKKQLGMVRRSSRHLLDLINDVLDISKIEAGELPLSLSSFSLGQSIEKVVELVLPLASRKGLDLRTKISTDVGYITADQRRLEQVILNLLNNAVKFTDTGGILLSCLVDDGNYLIAVSDSGMGIPRDEIEGIFRPFYQVDSGTARKQEGTGLGLSICDKLIAKMGGTIAVESEPGNGSTFSIRLPINNGKRHE